MVIIILSDDRIQGPLNQFQYLSKNFEIEFLFLKRSKIPACVDQNYLYISDLNVLQKIELLRRLINNTVLLFGFKVDLLFSFLSLLNDKCFSLCRTNPYIDYQQDRGLWPVFKSYIHTFLWKLKGTKVIAVSQSLKVDLSLYSAFVIRNFFTTPRLIDCVKKSGFVYVGSIDRRKRVDDAVSFVFEEYGEKLNIISLDNPSHILDESLLDKYEYLGGCASNVEVIRKIQPFRHLVLFSSGEGFPNVVLEAIACNKTCICSDISAHREVKSLFPDHVFLPGDVLPDTDPHPIDLDEYNDQLFEQYKSLL
ncbi:hypothetical protein N9755_01400 [bacterium]|nr:hypothetical protein [bacterium]